MLSQFSGHLITSLCGQMTTVQQWLNSEGSSSKSVGWKATIIESLLVNIQHHFMLHVRTYLSVRSNRLIHRLGKVVQQQIWRKVIDFNLQFISECKSKRLILKSDCSCLSYRKNKNGVFLRTTVYTQTNNVKFNTSKIPQQIIFCQHSTLA